MTKRNKISAEISTAKLETSILIGKDPSDDRLKFVSKELERMEILVNSKWPLSEDEKGAVVIGLYAVREIDDSYPDLAVRLTHIAYDLKHS